MFLKMIGKNPTWVFLTYERLPHVCYHSGRLNHKSKACKEKNQLSERSFGGWLKAEDQSKWVQSWTEEIAEENLLVVELSLATVFGDGKGRAEAKASGTLKTFIVP